MRVVRATSRGIFTTSRVALLWVSSLRGASARPPREGVSSKSGWGWGGVMREIGVLVQGMGGIRKSVRLCVQDPNCQMDLKNKMGGKKTFC